MEICIVRWLEKFQRSSIVLATCEDVVGEIEVKRLAGSLASCGFVFIVLLFSCPSQALPIKSSATLEKTGRWNLCGNSVAIPQGEDLSKCKNEEIFKGREDHFWELKITNGTDVTWKFLQIDFRYPDGRRYLPLNLLFETTQGRYLPMITQGFGADKDNAKTWKAFRDNIRPYFLEYDKSDDDNNPGVKPGETLYIGYRIPRGDGTYDVTNFNKVPVRVADALNVKSLKYHIGMRVEEKVPAPPTLALFGLGLAGLRWSRRRKA